MVVVCIVVDTLSEKYTGLFWDILIKLIFVFIFLLFLL